MLVKQYTIENLPNDVYIHLLELNIQFAKMHNTRPQLPDNYGNIVMLTNAGNYIVYGEFNSYALSPDIFDKPKYLSEHKIRACANCLIDENGYIIKNRWGFEDTKR